jgi:hypothetical protein
MSISPWFTGTETGLPTIRDDQKNGRGLAHFPPKRRIDYWSEKVRELAMEEVNHSVLTLFDETLACPSPTERAAHLDRARHGNAGRFLLEHSTGSRLLAPGEGQPISEGGFGMVFMAEQSDLIRRRVALEPDMDRLFLVAAIHQRSPKGGK